MDDVLFIYDAVEREREREGGEGNSCEAAVWILGRESSKENLGPHNVR